MAAMVDRDRLGFEAYFFILFSNASFTRANIWSIANVLNRWRSDDLSN
jgi:hypothetical protein